MGYLLFEGSAVKSRIVDSTRDSEINVRGIMREETKRNKIHTHRVSLVSGRSTPPARKERSRQRLGAAVTIFTANARRNIVETCWDSQVSREVSHREDWETRTYCTSRQQSLNTRWVICYLKDSAVCVCVFSSHPFWTSMDVPAGVTQEEGHTGFLIHLPSAVRALIFVARRIQPFLSLVDREVEFCVLTN